MNDPLDAFKMFDDRVRILFKEIITRVVNTMSNSFFGVAANKGVGAQMSLRDKLKGLCFKWSVRLKSKMKTVYILHLSYNV